MINNRKQKNVLLSMLMMLLFGYPIITIFNKPGFIYHIPILYAYIAIIWLISLLFLFVAAEAKPFQKIRKRKNE